MGDWAVLEILQREDGKGSVAKFQVISHSLGTAQDAEHVVRVIGSQDSLGYVIVPIPAGNVLSVFQSIGHTALWPKTLDAPTVTEEDVWAILDEFGRCAETLDHARVAFEKARSAHAEAGAIYRALVKRRAAERAAFTTPQSGGV